TLEIQSDKYKNRLKELNPRLYELSYPEGRNWIILQQKGLNDRTKEAFYNGPAVKTTLKIF
ncbi:MAG: hypothetical protein IKR40_12425, partial [Treponema sp.]|nr:hypothetical protein [Treponema sp.]